VQASRCLLRDSHRKKLLELEGIESVEASVGNGTVFVRGKEPLPSLKRLKRLFKKEGYRFFQSPKESKEELKKKDLLLAFFLGAVIIAVFWGLGKAGFGGFLNIRATFSSPMFFLLGLVAGFSTCAAPLGGLVLSLSKQWLLLYQKADSF